MATRTDESPPPQEDRDSERNRRWTDEPRSFEVDAEPAGSDPDTGGAWTDDPDINTHGSER